VLLEKYLAKRNVTLRVGDKFLPEGAGGSFDAIHRTLTVGSNPTEYEVWHELSHFIQYRKLKPMKYLGQIRTRTFNAPENFVFNMLRGTRRWGLLNEAEQSHAIWYIESYGGPR
jgi:hypothetical protein